MDRIDMTKLSLHIWQLRVDSARLRSHIDYLFELMFHSQFKEIQNVTSNVSKISF